MPELPEGVVTFLFSDIEGSTKLWEQHPDAMKQSLARHDVIMRGSVEAHRGNVFKTMGDAFFAVFAGAPDALKAAVAAQHTLRIEAWGETGPLQVRMALYTGEAELRDNDYFGPVLNRIARLLTNGSGGQVLVSLSTQEVVAKYLPAGVELRDLGERRLKDLPVPERIFQLVTPDSPDMPAEPLICPSCGAIHLPNTLFCDQCGHMLAGSVSTETEALTVTEALHTQTESSPAIKLSLITVDGEKKFTGVLNTALLIGRTDTASGSYPDIDLGGLQGFENGVSRRHARLLRSEQQVLIEDLNSLNGTFVQSTRLTAHHPHALQPGDELQFGKVVLRIHW